jgi:hypothetical protein
VHAHAGEEPVAGAGAESGRTTEVETVEQGGKKTTGTVAADALDDPTKNAAFAPGSSSDGVCPPQKT